MQFSEVWMDVRVPMDSEQFAFNFELSIQELLWIALQQNLFEEIFDCTKLHGKLRTSLITMICNIEI
ncbi:hypothetical protein T03_6449 [Trichinella britovi]|uniref:Uncharacterized protein n=1 Tax=Trichinella britovi TaxID=45882 RepID=A0A0V1D6D6_TRIBR|nr:hypothetical protein T03_6449 [Trichinella britovi]